jgi:integration host factor subunit beta
VTKSELIASLAARYSQLAARDTDYAVKTVKACQTKGITPLICDFLQAVK